MKQNVLETIVGVMVVCVAIAFLMFAYNLNTANDKSSTGYALQAQFQNIEGVTNGSDVMISGIKIGKVESLTLDKDSFYAIALLRINPDIKLAKDSQAAVITSSLLGAKYISITPGADDDYLQNNDQIKYTQSAINIESLIGKIIYSISNK